MPAKARENSDEGAVAFVEHYIDVFNFASATGKTDELDRLSSPSCEGCQSYIDLYRGTYDAGGFYQGSDWELGQFETEKRPQDAHVVYAAMSAPAGKYKSSTDDIERESKPEEAELVFSLEFREGRWLLEDFERGEA